MEKEFIKYELALRMKALRFDEPCAGFFDEGFLVLQFIHNGKIFNMSEDSCLAPTHQQALSWFRDNYGLYASLVPKKSYPDGYVSGIEWVVNICGGNGEEIGPDGIFTYKEAELACLDKLIEIVETKSE